MKPEDTLQYEQPESGSAWVVHAGLGAGIYFFQGRTHVAGHSSPAERWLVDQGALLIASIRFDADPLERAHARPVRALAADEAVRTFRASLVAS